MVKITPDPTRMAIIEPTFVGPAMKGQGNVDYLCPGCGAVALEGMVPAQVQNVAFTCFTCKTTSAPPTAQNLH